MLHHIVDGIYRFDLPIHYETEHGNDYYQSLGCDV